MHMHEVIRLGAANEKIHVGIRQEEVEPANGSEVPNRLS